MPASDRSLCQPSEAPLSPMSSPAAIAATEPAATECFHCGLPVPPGSHFRVDIDGAARPMCCR
ncbi:MAG: heavy metal translocating P-type ATPase metal-binding domain-containing protein, partial [Pseudomonadota bacterium]